jgi:Tfp pilus assembly protein PilO
MKQKYLIFSVIMLIIAVVFFVISGSLIGKKMSKIESLDKQIKSAQEKLNSAKILDQQLSQFALIIDNSLTREKIFSPVEINAFVKNLADLADQNHIGVLAIYPKEIQSSLNLVEQQYIMELNTTYVQLGQFLSNLEALDNIVKINTLDVMPLTEAESSRQSKTKDIVAAAPRIARYKVALELSVFKVQREA